jgi:hypothetical protein
MYQRGQAVRVGPEPGMADDTSGGDRTLTTLVFQNSNTSKKFAFDMDNEDGRFEVMLPPGEYGIRLRYHTWLSGTPAHSDVPEAAKRYYVGTLRVDLFRHTSILGFPARVFGGTVPQGDSDFDVLDEWEWTQANLQVPFPVQVTAEKRLMHLGETE